MFCGTNGICSYMPSVCFCKWRRYSIFPSGPFTGENSRLSTSNPIETAYSITLLITSRCTALSLTTPCFPTFSRPASNCGLIRQTICPSSDKSSFTGPNTLVSDINDIAGIRIICPLKSDIFTIRKYIREFNDINVIKEKDFVTHPKESGYTSYHMVVKVPVAIDNDISMVKVEIQIRSLAMDFWASLEHKIKYKPNGEINEDVSKELVKCARDINKLDNKMIKLFKK